MKTILKLFFLVIFLSSCKTNQDEKPEAKIISQKITENYEVIQSSNSNGLLILFPGGGATSEDTKREFKIIKPAIKNGVSLLLMNFRTGLWIEEADCIEITKQITTAINKHKLNIDKVYIGGISLGGNVALTLSDYLLKTDNNIKPKGVFVVDSPIDLYALYKSSLKDLQRKDFSEERLAEPKWIINFFESKFGGKDSILTNIQKVSSYTYLTNNYKNINHLKNIRLRLYTEPDSLWLKKMRQTDYKSTNAYALRRMFLNLNNSNWKNIQLIETKDKGYRANGEKNPHSWSIVDTNALIKWFNN